MADNKKYYYLKLKDSFFHSEEIKILESMPDGMLYTNLLLKLYLMSLKSSGKLRLNDSIPFDENMLAILTSLKVDIVGSGLKVLSSMGLIEIMDDGTIHLLYIQNYIGKSSSEGDRKRASRMKNGEIKGEGRSFSPGCPKIIPMKAGTNTGKTMDKCLPEKERELNAIVNSSEFIVKEKERENGGEVSLESLSLNLLKHVKLLAGDAKDISLAGLKIAVMNHGYDYVKMALERALEKNKLSMIYVTGILRNWEKEGYPPKDGEISYGCVGENTGADTEEKYSFRTRNTRELTDEEWRKISSEVL